VVFLGQKTEKKGNVFASVIFGCLRGFLFFSDECVLWRNFELKWGVKKCESFSGKIMQDGTKLPLIFRIFLFCILVRQKAEKVNFNLINYTFILILMFTSEKYRVAQKIVHKNFAWPPCCSNFLFSHVSFILGHSVEK
jgi:hypothetical protein